MGNPSYPSNRTNRATHYLSMFDRVVLPYNQRPVKPLCYTASKNFIYQPHTAYGMVGTSAAGYLARRNRL